MILSLGLYTNFSLFYYLLTAATLTLAESSFQMGGRATLIFCLILIFLSVVAFCFKIAWLVAPLFRESLPGVKSNLLYFEVICLKALSDVVTLSYLSIVDGIFLKSGVLMLCLSSNGILTAVVAACLIARCEKSPKRLSLSLCGMMVRNCCCFFRLL